MKSKYSEEDLKNAIITSDSFRSVAKKLNISSSNPFFRKRVKKYDISHFTKSRPGSSKYIDLIGKKFHRLLFVSIKESIKGDKKFKYGLFKCDCGKEKEILITSVMSNRTKSCGCAYKDSYKTRDDEVLNKKFYKLTVLEVYRKKDINHGFAKCLCDCGNICEKGIPCLKRFKNFGCRKCSSKHNSEINTLENNPSWKGCGKISCGFVWKIRRLAERRRIMFNEKEITPSFLWDLLQKQKFKCALSGEDLYINNISKTSEYNISLDRIDSSKGYFKDNVQWVTKHINVMKMQLSNETFIEVCNIVTNFQKQKNLSF